MDALTAILSRRVARDFAEKPVELETVKQIVEAGRHAMSARNLQPWLFIIIREPETLRELGALCSTGRFVADAPSAVAILKDTSNKRWADIDCAQAVQNMANAAWAMGLGTCWVGNFDAEAVGKLLNAPEGWAVFTVLPFGYIHPDNPPQGRPLKPRARTVYLEKFGAETA
jgi:nitroreductase